MQKFRYSLQFIVLKFHNFLFLSINGNQTVLLHINIFYEATWVKLVTLTVI